MFYVKMGDNGLPLEISTYLNEFEYSDSRWKSRWDWKSFEEVERVARYITAMTGDLYLAVDNTESTAPRYDIVRCPKIGDAVSYGFNGDYYPDGEVVKITKNLQITTSGGHTYRRFKNTGGWRRTGGTWWLISGHVDERNPHF